MTSSLKATRPDRLTENETWVAETLDNKFSKFYGRWLQNPVSGNISNFSLS